MVTDQKYKLFIVWEIFTLRNVLLWFSMVEHLEQQEQKLILKLTCMHHQIDYWNQFQELWRLHQDQHVFHWNSTTCELNVITEVLPSHRGQEQNLGLTNSTMMSVTVQITRPTVGTTPNVRSNHRIRVFWKKHFFHFLRPKNEVIFHFEGVKIFFWGSLTFFCLLQTVL